MLSFWVLYIYPRNTFCRRNLEILPVWLVTVSSLGCRKSNNFRQCGSSVNCHLDSQVCHYTLVSRLRPIIFIVPMVKVLDFIDFHLPACDGPS